MSIHSSSSGRAQAPALPVATSTETTDVSGIADKSANARHPEALDLLFFTTKDHAPISSDIEDLAKVERVAVKTLFVEDFASRSEEEEMKNMKDCLAELQRQGKIDKFTNIFFQMHGTVDSEVHYMAAKDGTFEKKTSKLISHAKQALVEGVNSHDKKSWEGSMHASSCGVARAAKDLKDERGLTLLYGGKKITSSQNSETIMRKIIEEIGKFKKNPERHPFPSAHDFFLLAGSIGGEKVTLVGNNNLLEIKSGYLPPKEELSKQAVVDKLTNTLHMKVVHGKPDTVKKMMELVKGKILQNTGSLFFMGALFLSDDGVFEEKLKILLDAGVDLNDDDICGDTILHKAIQEEKFEKTRILLKNRANLYKKNNKGLTPYDIAAELKDKALLMDIIEAGADVEYPDDRGRTALHRACLDNDVELVKFLLKKGADPYRQCVNTETPLTFAVYQKNFHIVDLLLADADKKIKVPTDWHPGILLRVLAGNQSELFMKMISCCSEKQVTLSRLLESIEQDVEANYENEGFDDDVFEAHKKTLSLFVRTVLDLDPGGKVYLVDFLKSLALSGEEKYLKFIVSIAGVTDKLGEQLKALSSELHAKGMKKVSHILDAALKHKLN